MIYSNEIDIIENIKILKYPSCCMCMALKPQEWNDGVVCNHTWVIVKWGSFLTAILKNNNENFVC